MEITASDIHAEIAKVCPIRGVSIGKLTDKETWIVDFDPAASASQRDAAQSAIRAIDVSLPIVRDPLDSWDVISLKIAFNHENRIRALESKAAITVAQFKIAVRAML
ncbi:hypothetical protein [Bradyrhizobium tunisiense]|uniref:hypothetical protein n=1 Tax=Bradyrhizobium tunisiense TaxID=3278709 RepID=UPI0035DE944A